MNDITTLRETLFETLSAVKSGAMDLDRARTVNEIGKTLIDSARVEVDFIRATDGTTSAFLQPTKQETPLGVVSVFQHRIAG